MGEGGFVSHFILSKIAIMNLGQNKWKIWAPPPPISMMKKKKSAFWFAPELVIEMGEGGFCFSFYLFQDCRLINASSVVTRKLKNAG